MIVFRASFSNVISTYYTYTIERGFSGLQCLIICSIKDLVYRLQEAITCAHQAWVTTLLLVGEKNF